MLQSNHLLFLRGLVLTLIGIKFSFGSNWAQTSGRLQQTITITQIPAPDRPHWSARYGHATAILNTGTVQEVGQVYLMGGDSYYGDLKETNLGILNTLKANGYLNDVWSATPTGWIVRSDVRLRGPKYPHFDNPQDRVRHQKLPRVYSEMTWTLVQAGIQPPAYPPISYDKWIICQSYFAAAAGRTTQYTKDREDQGCCETWTDANTPCNDNNVMWSPRRHHSAVSMVIEEGNGNKIQYLYVMGGRAREFLESGYEEEKSIGGIMGPRVQDPENAQLLFSLKREASVLKNDVWRSVDGKNWELVTPGCKAPQSELIPQKVAWSIHNGKVIKNITYGHAEFVCKGDIDCYGEERCDPVRKTCVCPMWSPREQFGATAYNGWIYIAGGFTSVAYSQRSFCGKFACGATDPSDYRNYMNDVWKWDGQKGSKWVLVFSFGQKETFPIRGGLQLLAFPDSNNHYNLWVIGGRFGDNTGNTRKIGYYNDIWLANITNNGFLAEFKNFSKETKNPIPWTPRASHVAVYEPGTASNANTRRLYVIGGDLGKGRFSDETWVLLLNDDSTERWRKDYTHDELFYTGTQNVVFRNSSPSTYYVYADAPIEFMRRFWLPLKVRGTKSFAPELREYISQHQIDMLTALNITTIRELANADVYQILQLRGYAPEGVINTMDFTDVCDYKALAEGIVDKCEISQRVGFYDGENQMPWNTIPEFGGTAPLYTGPSWKDNWHGRGYGFLQPVISYKDQVAKWDGCAALNLPIVTTIALNNRPNVPGIGWVDVPKSIKNPAAILAELQCKYYPRTRAYHTGLLFEERVYIFGGKSTEEMFNANSWYRDARFPTVRMTTKPTTYTTESIFDFRADEPGCKFEYRIWDPVDYKEIKAWTPVVKRAEVRYLQWRNNGPGNGLYILYVRAIDPAGNYDTTYREGRNLHTWFYVSPTPWDIIAEGVFSFIGLCGIAYLEYRRRMKKAAMERYAMKRMRRKFKALQKDIEGGEVDWRTLYNEAKVKGGIGKKAQKAKVDKNKEKRDNEKKKRDKEKENIKKKLKAGKDFKEKKKKEAAMSEGDAAKKSSKKKSKKVSPDEGETDAALEEKADFPEKVKPSDSAPRLKDNEKGKVAVAPDDGKQPRLKDYEKPGAEASSPGKEGGKETKFKDYEKATAASAAASAAEEGTAKQRKVNKRFKDYEGKDGEGGDTTKKDV